MGCPCRDKAKDAVTSAQQEQQTPPAPQPADAVVASGGGQR